MNKRVSLTALAVLLSAMLSGCGSLAVGEEEFACTGMPGSVFCHSARDVYEITNEGVVPSPVGKTDGSYNEDCKDCVRAEDVNPTLRVEEDENTKFAVKAGEEGGEEKIRVIDTKTGQERIVKKKTLAVTDDEIINNYVAPRLPTEPVPIRTPSQVMRIWIAPFVDTNGDLIAPGFVYTEIEPRRWIYPDDHQNGNSRTFEPLLSKAKNSSTYQKPKVENINSLEKLKEDQRKMH